MPRTRPHRSARLGDASPAWRAFAAFCRMRRQPRYDAPAVAIATSSRRRVLRLSTQIVLLQLALIVLTVGTGVGVSLFHAKQTLNADGASDSLAIAHSVARMPAIVDAFSSKDPAATIDPIVEPIRRLTGASFIVVANRAGIRFSHPNPALIGKSLLHDPGENPAPVLSGRTYVGVQTGSLGRSVRAKVPIYAPGARRVIGLVSVGLLERTLSAQLRSDLPVVLIPPLIGLLLGAIGSVFLARRIKRKIYGLEPDEIGALLEQREAMLHGIREGAIGIDAGGRVILVNDQAQRLLELDDSAVGGRLEDVVPDGPIRALLSGATEGVDELIVVGQRVLVANYMPVSSHGHELGGVVTLRDRTELEGLLRALDDLRSLADGLRAKDHEYANTLHTLWGLVELERYDEVAGFISNSASVHHRFVGDLVEQVRDPLVVALLLGKAAIAAEQGVELRIAPESCLAEGAPEAKDLVTVVGNLIDNALDAVTLAGQEHGWIEVGVVQGRHGIVVRVHDSGPGVERELMDEIFRDGFSTKPRSGAVERGLGLALVRQLVRRRGGRVTVENDGGAVFTVYLPSRSPVTAEPAMAAAE